MIHHDKKASINLMVLIMKIIIICIISTHLDSLQFIQKVLDQDHVVDKLKKLKLLTNQIY